MRKIKLDLDALQVESFETGAGRGAARGTVHGAVDTQACPTSQEPGGPCATILNCGEVTGIACIASEGCGPDTFAGVLTRRPSSTDVLACLPPEKLHYTQRNRDTEERHGCCSSVSLFLRV